MRGPTWRWPHLPKLDSASSDHSPHTCKHTPARTHTHRGGIQYCGFVTKQFVDARGTHHQNKNANSDRPAYSFLFPIFFHCILSRLRLLLHSKTPNESRRSTSKSLSLLSFPFLIPQGPTSSHLPFPSHLPDQYLLQLAAVIFFSTSSGD